ncbi:hypothetical protein M9Y10_028431 [Tritrichomonas musculus]|uniref:Uncharacterized protein n=1 Tax=Tritrichomonas musculus TaxID=1915356 RepID=A0ABR2KJB1_9EUKA
MESEVSLNDELQTLMENINNLTSAKTTEDENSKQFNELLKQLSTSLSKNIDSLAQFSQEYKQRLGSCAKAFEEIPVNPFEKAVHSNIAFLKKFLESNDPSKFFIPQMQQKTTVILDFLSKLSDFIADNKIYMKWAELALLDFDTQDWHIRQSAPEVLKRFQNSITKLNTSDSRMVLHIVRSLLLDFKA